MTISCTRAARWFATADELGAFHQARGRWPSKNIGDPDGRHLAGFVEGARSLVAGRPGRSLSLERRAYLDAVAPGWLLGREGA